MSYAQFCEWGNKSNSNATAHTRHGDRANTAWSDGHVESLTATAMGEEHVAEIYICKADKTTPEALKKN